MKDGSKEDSEEEDMLVKTIMDHRCSDMSLTDIAIHKVFGVST